MGSEGKELLDWLRDGLATPHSDVFLSQKLGPGLGAYRVIVQESGSDVFAYDYRSQVTSNLTHGFCLSPSNAVKVAAESILWRLGSKRWIRDEGSLHRIASMSAIALGCMALCLILAIVALVYSLWGLLFIAMVIGAFWLLEGALNKFLLDHWRRDSLMLARQFDEKVSGKLDIPLEARKITSEEKAAGQADWTIVAASYQKLQAQIKARRKRMSWSLSAFYRRLLSSRYKRVLGPFSPWLRVAFFPSRESRFFFRGSFGEVVGKWWKPFGIVTFLILYILYLFIDPHWSLYQIFEMGMMPDPFFWIGSAILISYYGLVLIQTIAIFAVRQKVREWRKERLASRRQKLLTLANQAQENPSTADFPKMHRNDNYLTQKQLIW